MIRGELDFISAEEVVGHLMTLDGDRDDHRVVLDVTAVTRVRPAAERLLARTANLLEDAGLDVCAVDTSGVLDGRSPDGGRPLRRVDD